MQAETHTRCSQGVCLHTWMRQFALNQAGALTPSTGLLCCHRNTQEENLTHTELSFCNNSRLLCFYC